MLASVVTLAGLALTIGLVRRWLRGVGRVTVLRFRVRLDRYKLVRRRLVRAELQRDPVVCSGIDDHARARGLPPARVAAEVEHYLDEIVPFFNVLAYDKVGSGWVPSFR